MGPYALRRARTLSLGLFRLLPDLAVIRSWTALGLAPAMARNTSASSAFLTGLAAIVSGIEIEHFKCIPLAHPGLVHRHAVVTAVIGTEYPSRPSQYKVRSSILSIVCQPCDIPATSKGQPPRRKFHSQLTATIAAVVHEIVEKRIQASTPPYPAAFTASASPTSAFCSAACREARPVAVAADASRPT